MDADDLLRFELLRELETDERDAVLEVLERRDLDRGAILYDEGESADGLILVERGGLRVESRRAGELGVAGEGTTLGLCALAGPGRRETRVVAVMGSRVFVLTRDALRGLVQREPRAACKVLDAALRRLSDDVREGLDRFVASVGARS